MHTIYFNNSSLDKLACSARYRAEIIRGARTIKSPEQGIGTAFHALMAAAAPDTNPGLLHVIANSSCKEYKTLSTSTQLTLTNLANTVRADIKLDKNPYTIRERYIEFLDTPKLDYTDWETTPEDFNLTRCLTPDVVTYDSLDESATITDYKTTRKPIDADLFTDYALKSQRLFYIVSLQDAAERCAIQDIPAEMHNAIRQGRIKFRYVFVNYIQNKVFVQPPQYVHQDALHVFRGALHEKQALAVFLHFNPSAAQKEGMFSNHCYFCPFKRICAEHNPQREQELLDAWPMGFAPYDPRHFK